MTTSLQTLTLLPWRRHVTSGDAILNHPHQGEGTDEKPYIVTWLPNDEENPLTWGYGYKWGVTVLAAVAVLAVTMSSSMMSAAIVTIEQDFPGGSAQSYTMITSGFVLGFVAGPLLWAPCSEVFGRRNMFIFTYIPFTIFLAGCCGANNLATLVVLRFFAGFFGSSPLTSAGGVIADMFPASQRGLALGIFAAAPFLGPSIGPVAGGFLAEAAGWRWVGAVLAFFAALLTVLGAVLSPETYAPVLLRRRASRLSTQTGKKYLSQQDAAKPQDIKALFASQLRKPWELLFREPICLLLALYMSIIYAILYMQFTAFPIVFEVERGWSPGIAGLPFIGLTVGAFSALGYVVFFENNRYAKKLEAEGGYLPAENRLPSVMIGAVVFPAGLFIFAWTAYPIHIHWIAPVIGTVLIGVGLVLLFLGLMNFLVDTYLLYAASALAGNTIMRSLFGVVFPLFTPNMYSSLGVNWAGSLTAFIALAFMPAPFIFYVYGSRIRRLSKYARQADDLGKMMAQKMKAEKMASAAPKETQREMEEDVEQLGGELTEAISESADPNVTTKLEQVQSRNL